MHLFGYVIQLGNGFLCSPDFCFKINFSKNSSSNTQGVPNQTFWIQNRPDILSCLIWVQIVCKDYLIATLAGKELKIEFHPKISCVVGNLSI